VSRLRSLLRYIDELSLVTIGLVLFLVASNTQTGWVYLLSGTIFGALITGWWTSRRALRPEGFQLWVPGSAPRGQGFAATLSWASAARGYTAYWRPLEGLRIEQLGRETVRLSPDLREQRIWLVVERRGVYDWLDGEITCYGPLAWFAAHRPLTPRLSQPLHVLPRRRQMSQQAVQALSRGELGERRGQPSGQGDLRRLRDYQVGDDVRSIHWASSARRGELVVREFSQGGGRQLALCWGCHPESVHELEAFEEMLDWVYTFFAHARESGWPVKLLTPHADGSWQVSEQAEVLAYAEPRATPAPPVWNEQEGWARIDFWLGPCPGQAARVFEFGQQASLERRLA
jgi:uncharacterized protein (DUF58 family)